MRVKFCTSLLFFGLLLLSTPLFSLHAQMRGMKPAQGESPAGTERRLALVVGNNNYQYVKRLKNPANDADDMAVALESLGFEVIKRKDLTEKELKQTIDDFGNRLRQYDVGLFYYAGHGVQYEGNNYLVPVDAQVKVATEIEYTCVNLGRTMAKMEGANLKVSLAFIDACRENPFEGETRSMMANGLNIPNNPPGSFVAFSTRAGKTASDNQEGRNGLFTSELLRHLTVPNLGIRDILDRTTQGVSARSNKTQIPGRYDELTGDFKFVVTGVSAVPSAISTDFVEKPTTEKGDVPSVKTAQSVKFMDLPFADMVYVSGGSFMMGDSKGKSDEQPIHSVQVDGFWIGKYEVTQAQWESVMGNNPSKFKKCSDCPVENVSWLDAIAFCNKLSDREGKQRVYTMNGNDVKIDYLVHGYRLPTEAEWEYAARGGNKSKGYRYAGENELASVSWFGDNAKNKTRVVGQKQPNELGIYDMSGNVWEFCNDWYGEDYYASSQNNNPLGPPSGSYRVLRGGGWLSASTSCRVSERSVSTPTTFFITSGFRVVISQ
ncbi:MAG: SUMF1/EgtB/PvdO family nonheme iron enzyme [Spirosomataceae bacterium]